MSLSFSAAVVQPAVAQQQSTEVEEWVTASMCYADNRGIDLDQPLSLLALPCFIPPPTPAASSHYKWEPNSYCHFHRHTARTTSTVLAGELHVVDIDLETDKGINHRVREAGDNACKNLGDVHMEYGGRDGALVLFNIYNP